METLIAQSRLERYNELIMNYQDFLSSHKRKIIIGAPIIFLLLVNVSGIGAGNIFYFTAENTLFASVGDAVPVRLEISTKSPINAVGGKVVFPSDILQVDAVTRSTSIIDLWSEDPLISNTAGTIHWSGGIVNNDNQKELRGTVFTISFHASKTGKAKLKVEEGELLAKNGEGTNILSGSDTITLYVREQGHPSPDINDDGVLSLSDINTLYIKTFSAYDERYDINKDGKLNWSDVTALIAIM